MICRFNVVLPFRIGVVDRAALKPLQFLRDSDQVCIYPPFRARKVFVPERGELIPIAEPDLLQNEDDGRMVNRCPTIQGDLLRIDLVRDDFDRRESSSSDSLRSTLFQIANEFLTSLRTLTGSSLILPISIASTMKIEYLNNDDSQLAPVEGLCRYENSTTVVLDFTPLDSDLWKGISSLLPTYEPPVFEALILDAHASRQEVGTSIVLLATALEVLVDTALKHTSTAVSLPEGLWNWINDRSGDYRKQPSVEEQWHLLGIFTGRFLKRNTKPWAEYLKIKKARNSYVHKGRVDIDGKALAPADIGNMINAANEIIEFVRPVLPEEQQSKRSNGQYELSRRAIDAIYPARAVAGQQGDTASR